MAKAQDIRFDDEFDDLFISSTGDFEVKESDTRHVNDLVESWVGWWKEFPSVGVGAFRYLGASGGFQRLVRSIKIQLKGDGYSVKQVTTDQKENIYITGDRKNVNL